MLIQGEKYACDACVRGHRVSSCTHTDRPLIHINKKGRPVSQCPHCRGLRKARAQHVKCACAEKTHTKDHCAQHKNKRTKGEGSTCCCSHGARCTCALKKEHSLDPVPEDFPSAHGEPQMMKGGRGQPRPSFVSSTESKTTVFMNGHHKPVHKNDIHNLVGVPYYKVPARSHTISGNRESSKKSAENLLVAKDLTCGLSNTPPRSVTSAPHSVPRAKSEHGSPTIDALPLPHDTYVPPINIPSYDTHTYSGSPISCGSPAIPSGGSSPWDGRLPDHFPDSYFISYEAANDIEHSASPVGFGLDSAEVDWSTYNLPNRLGSIGMGSRLPNGGFMPSQPPSHASFDCFSHLSHHDLTSSSGDISELEDFVPVTDSGSLHGTSQEALNDFSDIIGEKREDIRGFQSSSASSYAGTPPTNMLASPTPDPPDIDELVKNAKARSLEIELQRQRMHQRQLQQPQRCSITSNPQNMFGHSPDLMYQPFSVQEAQDYSHPMDPVNVLCSENMTGPSANVPSDSVTSFPYPPADNYSDTDERKDGWTR